MAKPVSASAQPQSDTSNGYEFRFVFSSPPVLISMLIALPFVCSDVATFFILNILRVGTRLATLVSLQQMARTVGTATRVACINCRTSGQ